MASVYKKVFTKPLPDGAEIVSRKGVRLARWKDRKGERQTGVVFEGADGTLRVRVESSTYVAKYRDGLGLLQEVSTGCRTKDGAQKVLSDLLARAENVKSGVVSAEDDAVRDWLDTPIADSLTVYLEGLRSKGRSETHVADCKRLTELVVSECGMRNLRDLKASPIERWLAARLQTDVAGAADDESADSAKKKTSPRTRNSYLQAVRAFCRWYVDTGRLASDPTKRIAKLDEAVDRRRSRRSMTAQELERLLYVTRWRPLADRGRPSIKKAKDNESEEKKGWTRGPLTYDGIPSAVERARQKLAKEPATVARLEQLGRERALIYKTMVLTGLRRGELTSLTIGSIELDGPAPCIVLKARDAKNRQQAVLPVRADLAADLRSWVEDKRDAILGGLAASAGVLSIKDGKPASLPLQTSLFDMPGQLIKIFDLDLQVAGIAKADDRGRTLDIHALRHSFGSLLSAGGVAPRTAQAALRHSTIDLTMNVYTDPRLLDVTGALDALPALPLDHQPRERQQARATGTDDAQPRASDFEVQPSPRTLAPMLAPDFGNRCQAASFDGKKQESELRSEHEKTPRKQAVSRGFGERRRPDSNRGCRICNPMP